MTPTSPSDPDPLPPGLDAALAELPADERAALLQTWTVAAEIAAPPAPAERKAATWAILQEQIGTSTAPNPSRRRLDRAPARGFRHTRLRPALAICVALLAAVVLVWPLAFPQQSDAHRRWQAVEDSGQVTLVRLPDGSVVRLDPGATLQALDDHPDERSYALVGTATFEVARDEAHPFHVRTSRVDITVLGTTFRVASENAKGTRVVVHEGHIAVTTHNRRVEARRGEQVIAAETDDPLVVRPLPGSEQAVFAYRDATLRAVLHEIELLFDTPISYPVDAAAQRITITRHGPLDVNELLQSVCAPLGLRYRPTADGFEVYRPA